MAVCEPIKPESCTFGVQDRDGSVCYYEGAAIRSDWAFSETGQTSMVSVLVESYTKKWINCQCPLPGYDEVAEALLPVNGNILRMRGWYCEHGVGWYIDGLEYREGPVRIDWRRL